LVYMPVWPAGFKLFKLCAKAIATRADCRSRA
jgi:hypothetical protein